MSAKKGKNKYIPINSNVIEVDDEIYYEYYRPVWRERKRSQNSGRCRCTKRNLWKCDGVCTGCKYYAAGNLCSLDVEIEGQEGVTLKDILPETKCSLDDLVETKDLYEALHTTLSQLPTLQKAICEYLMMGKTEREIATLLEKSQSTINYQKKKAFKVLREILKIYM